MGGNTYGDKGITKKIAEITKQLKNLNVQKNELSSKINILNKELLKYTSGEISPNQKTIFDL
jgi:archaellum component FlaC